MGLPGSSPRPSARGAARPLAALALAAALCAVTATSANAADPPAQPAAPPPPAPVAAPEAQAAPAAEAPALETIPPPIQLVPEMVPVKAPPPGILRNPLGLCRPDPCTSPFLTDTDLRLHLRTFYFDRHNPDESINEAWAFGGWLQYTSGWFRDFFQVGATGYTSLPVYAPEEHDGTSLLAPGQESITVLGQAYARLRYREAAVLTAYRQSVNDGYVGPQDNRMIPNAFEGVTLRGKLGKVEYGSGYLWDMKPRNSDSFLPMGEQAGVDGSEEGLWFGSVKWKPSKCWEVFAGDYYTPDIFNTAYGYVKHVRPLGRAEFQAGVQVTDQRSVGDEGLGSFETWNVGLGARVIWDCGLTLGAAFHATGDDANIRSPYGTWPGYLSLIETDFDRANEKAFGIGLKYDFGKGCGGPCIPGLLGVLAYAHGADRQDPVTGDDISDTDEFDFDLTYDVPSVKGLQLRFRNAYVDTGGEQTGYQFRLIVNWEIDLL